VSRDDERGLVHVAFHGTLTASTAPLAQSTLVKCLVEQPVAVVIDVADVLSRSTIAVPLFLALRREARRAPAVPLVVVAGRASTGSALRSALSRYLPTCVTIEEARDMAARLPSASRWHHVHLAATPYAPSEARNAVAECCSRWKLYGLIHPARTVVSELVSNAVEHAGTDIELTVTLRGRFLCVAVRDGSPVVPRLLEPVPHEPNAPLDVRGYGLRMITNAAHSWGAEITAEGKVVWATLLTTGPIAEQRRRAGHPAWQVAAD
jgi:anti-sigma regulatory factor (Ser/Thr protein kinase)